MIILLKKLFKQTDKPQTASLGKGFFANHKFRTLLLKRILVFSLLPFFLFGPLTPVLAQEASDSASLVINQIFEQDSSIPTLTLPFDSLGKALTITTYFGQHYDDPQLQEKLALEEPNGHNGIDFDMAGDTPILAVDDGTVEKTGDGDFGVTIVIRHKWGKSVYGHLSKINIQPNQVVTKGQIVGFSGSSGISSGSHLHFGIKPQNPDFSNGYSGFIDPAPYLNIVNDGVTAKVLAEATSSAILASKEASTSATLSGPAESTPSATFEDLSQNNEFLYNYKFNLKDGVTAHFYDKKTKSASFAIADADFDYKLRFALKESSNSATPKVDGNKIEFPVTISDIPMTLRYTVTEDRVKEEFVIDKNPFIDEPIGKDLTIDFQTTDQGLTSKKEGSGGYIFDLEEQDFDWLILPPTVEDSQGKSGEISLDIQEDQGEASLIVNKEFLENASYPVIIDPTWTQSNWAGGSGQTNWSDTTKYSSSSDVTTSTANQVTLTPVEKLSNTGFETNLTGWTSSTQTSTIQPDGTAGYDTYVVHDDINEKSTSTLFRVGAPGSAQSWQRLASLIKFDLSGIPAGATIDSATLTLTSDDDAWQDHGTIAAYRILVANSGWLETTTWNYAQPVSARWAGDAASDGGADAGGSISGTDHASAALGTIVIGNVNLDVGVVFNMTLSTSEVTSMLASNYGMYLRKTADVVGTSIASSDNATAAYRPKLVTNYTFGVRDTSTTYNASSGSVKLQTGSNGAGTYTQSINVGNTNSYNLSAYAYTDGSAVTSSDASLYYNGSTVSTTYTSVGSGWYQLTGTVTGVASSVGVGAQAESGKTVYLDNISLNNYASSGTVTSSIFNTTAGGSNWGALTYTVTTPTNTTVTVKIRTSNNSDMSGATAFASCDTISSGADISSNNCVTDTHRYIQYLITLSTTVTSATPTFSSFSLIYTASDVTAPTISVTPLSPDPTSDNTPSITGTATDASTALTAIEFDIDSSGSFSTCTATDGAIDETSEAFTCTTSALADGSHTIRIRATDSASNTTASVDYGTDTFTVDTTAPAAPTDTASTSHTTLIWSADATIDMGWIAGTDPGGSGVAGYSYTFDTTATTVPDTTSDTTLTTVTSSTLTTSNSHYFHIRTIDNAGNGSTTIHPGPFYVDTTVPALPGTTTISVSPTTPMTNTTPTFSWTASTDAHSGLASTAYTVKWSQSATFASGVTTQTTNSTSYQISAVTDGTWYFRVIVTDAVGNTSTYTDKSFIVDNQAPNAPTGVLATNPTNDITPTWSWTAPSDNGSAGVSSYSVQWCGNSAFTDCASNTGTSASASFTHSTDLAVSTWYFRVKAIDGASNESSYSSAGSTEIEITAPTDPGTPSTDNPTPDTTPTWTWTASTDAGVGLATNAYNVQWCDASNSFAAGSCLNFTSTSTSNSFTHSIVLAGAPTTWYFRVQSVDRAGNTSNWVQGSTVVDTTVPTKPTNVSTTTPTTNKKPAWIWTASTPSGASTISSYTVNWSTSSTFASGVNSASPAPTTFTHTSDLADGTWYFRVKAIDSLSKESAWSDTTSVVVDATAPSTPGTPSSASAADDTTPTWSWTASTDSGVGLAATPYTVNWSQDSTFTTGVSSSTSTTNSFTHSTPLDQGTWYFKVRAKDTLDNTSSFSSNGSHAVTTDDTAPTGSVLINGNDASTASRTVTLTISATDNADSAALLQMQVSENSSFNSASWETYATSKSWTFSATEETKNIYVRFKDSGDNISTTYSDSIYYDLTAPNTPTLESPADGIYSNLDRPEFVWKASSSPDTTSGLNYYQLKVVNENGTSFTISDIPVSRTSEYRTSKFVVNYENFSDSDLTNDIIKIHTILSSDWTASENGGKLAEGKNTWSIVSVDRAGNPATISRTIYTDFTAPKINSLTIDNLGKVEGLLLLATTKPTLQGLVSDNFYPNQIEWMYLKQNSFLGLNFGLSSSSEILSLKNIDQQSLLNFLLKAQTGTDFGKVVLGVRVIDQAGNKSEIWTFYLHILPEDQARELLRLSGDQDALNKLNSESSTSISALEKQAKTRREKEAAALKELVSALALTAIQIQTATASFYDSLSQFLKDQTSLTLLSSKQISEQLEKIYQPIQSTIPAWGQNFIQTRDKFKTNLTGLTTQTSRTIGNDFNNSIYQLSLLSQSIIDNLNYITPQIIENMALQGGDVFNIYYQNSLSLNNRLEDMTNRSSEKVVTNFDQNQSLTEEQFKNTLNNLEQSVSLAESLTKTYSSSQEYTKQKFKQAHLKNQQELQNSVTYLTQALSQPTNQVAGFVDRTRIWVLSFNDIVIDPNPTVIADVTIEEIGPDHAVISWKTNHFASGKANYGTDLSYGQEVFETGKTKDHKIKLTNLEKGKRYFFEVMSEGKNYTYDAYYSFETKP